MRCRLSIVSLAVLTGLVGSSFPWAFAEDSPAVRSEAAAQTQPVVDNEAPVAPISIGTQTDVLNLTDDLELAKAQVSEYPDNAEAHFLYAIALSRSPYLEQAFQEVAEARKLLKAQNDLGLIDRTIEQYQSLAEAHPNHDVVLYRLAFANYFKGYLLEKYPGDFANTPSEPAKAYYARSKEYMNKVISIKPEDIWARNYLGHVVLEHEKNVDEAIKIWKDSLAINNSQNPGALLMLARAYSMRGDIQNAIIFGAQGLQQKQAMGLQINIK